MIDTRELRGKKAELLAKIDFTKRKKQEIINSGKDLIDGRTSEQWIKYYDDFLFYYQKQIADCEKQIKKSKMGFLIGKTSSVLSILIIFVFFFFMGYTAYTFSGAMINKVSDIRITQESEPLIGELSSGVFLEGRDITDSTTQYPAIVGKPVKWKAEVGKEDVDAGTLFLPEDAENIIIRKGEEKKDITLDIEINKKSFLGVFNKRVEVELEELDEYEIKYETPAPESEVEIISDFKGRVLIKGPDDIHYENILSFTEIPETLRVGEERKLKLYEIKNGKRKEIEVYTYDSNENGLIDHIEWITPRLSEAVFEWSINVLNVQSYPTVGGSWKAEFETIGTADLRIRAVNETTWTNYSDLGYDLKFLEIRCGEDVLDYVWDDGGILIENYSCDEIGFEVSRVLTEGVHDLEFDFGGEKAYAHNFAAGIVLDSVSQTFSNGEVATWAHTIGNGKNRVLIVSSTSSSSSLSSDIISITYNGKVFSRADFVIESSNPIYGQSEILYLLEKDLPVVAGVYDIEIIYSEFKIYSSVSGISLENVKQENLVLGDTAINAGASCIGPCLFHGIRAQKGDWIVEVAGFVNPSSMVPFANPTLPGQVKRWEIGNIGEVLGVGSTKLTETTGWINTGWDIGVETSDSVTRVLAVFSPAYDVVEEVKNCFDGIISYWNFDEGKGNIAYDFFGNNNGVLENMNDLDWVIGQVDGALVFDGVDDFVRVGMVAGDELNFDSLKNYTWTGWFRTNDITKRQTIFDYQCNEGVSGISIVLNNSALKIYDCEVQGFIYNSGILNQDEWYNFAITYSDRGYDIFINGISQPGVIGNPKDSTGDIYIGGDSFGGNIFSGEIDEIAVSDRVLTSSQIHQLYQNSLGGYGGCDDKIPPEIKFEKPTFEDGVISNENNIFINVSSSDLNNISTFIDFDGSLLGWFTFGEGSKNLITNGRFDSDSDWIKDGGWTIDNGVASYDGIGDGVISQDFGTIIGHTYEITFSVDFNGTGQVSTILGGQSGIVIQSGDGDGDGDGIYTFQITATTTGVFSLKCADGDQTDIDNILIRDITDIADYMYNSEGVAIGDAVQIDSGYFGKGFSFDGDGDYIDFLGSSLIDNIEDQFSFSVWVKPEFDNTEISGKTIFDNERIIRMKYQASESDFRLILDSGIDILCDTQGLSWVAGEWHNFAGTYNGTTISLYWDSILDNTCAYSGDILSIPNTDFKIGDNWDGGSSWLGVIDDVMIFNRSLSNEEIRALYANTTEKYLDVVFGGLSNGDYNFKAYSQDKAGNVNSTELRIVTVDVIAPEISITYPVDKAAYISNITSINYTVISGDSCWYSNDSGVTNSSSVSAGTRFSVNLGTSNLTVYCNNSIGVVAQGDISFIVGDFDVVNEINKIMASDAEASDYFGSSVFMRGDYAIIGAFYGSTGGSQSGAAYIFKKNSTGQYEEVNKIQASDAEANDHFGRSVSLSGDYAIIGASYEDTGGSNAGAGYIFKKNSTGQYEEVNKIQASDAESNDYFGRSVSLSGDYAIIGASYEDTGGSQSGAAYIFKKNSTGQYEEVNKIQASDAQVSDYFGNSVSISGDHAIVGAKGESTGGSQSGAAYIFKKNSTGQYEEVNKIQASDVQAGDYFGWSVSISGDHAIVGAFLEDTGGTDTGAGYIFKKNSTGQFEEINKIQASDVQPSDSFGWSVSLSGDYAIIGAFYESTGGSQSGAAYIFKKNSTGQYEEVNKIQASDAEANDHFGSSISISGDHAIVGANGEDTGGTGAGAGYIFKLDVGTNAPEILDIEPPIDPILVEYTSVESETTSIDFSFIVWDVNGVSDLPEIGFGNIVSGGYFENIDNTPYHYNTQRNFNGNDCHTMFDFVDDGTYGHLGDTLRRYTCNLDMFYYDDPEPWDIYITSFQDINGLEASNLDYVEEDAFSPQENSGIDISEASLSFGAISPVMSEGVSSISDMVITNTGNANFNAVGGAYTIYFKGRDLTRQGGAEKILAENFIAHLDDVSPATCDNALDFITLLDYVDDDNDGIGFDSLILPNGDISQGDATKTVYYCMKSINSGLPVGDYSTTSSNNNPWEINIGPVVFSLSIIKFIKFNFEFVLILSVVAVRVRVKNGKKNRKKKEKDGNKKKLINEENLLEVFEGKLKEKYDIVMSELVGVVKDKKKLGINEGIGEESKRNVKVPLIIFRQGLSPAEVLSKYLRENLGMRFSEIGKLINRDEKTISTNYKNSVLKVKRELDIDRGMLVPALIFADRRLSVLESVVNYLKKKEFRNLEIAEMLGKDQRNISTLYLRVRKKLR